MATAKILSHEEMAATGFTHCATIDYSELVALGAVSSGVLTLISGLGIGSIIKGAYFYLQTAFDGGATSALALDVGYNLAAGTDDPDAAVDNYEVHADATEILAGDGNGAIFATLRTGYAFRESATIEALFTATGGNLNVLTAGKVHIFLEIVDLTKLVNPS